MENRIVEILIYLEFIFVALIIIFTFIIRSIYFVELRKNTQLTREITAFFAKLIPSTTPFNLENFSEKWRKIEIITPILIRYRRLVDDESWINTKLQVVRTLMLPLARQAAMSRNWVLRFYAAETFSVIYEKDDEQYIIKLMRDDAPLVKINAFSAAIALGTPECIHFIIVEMAAETFLTQTLYLQAFTNAPLKTKPLVIQELLESKDLSVRATCYSILIKYPTSPIDWNILPDIQSSDLKLMLAAIRFLALTDKVKATPILLDCLQDNRWEVKAVAIYFASYLQLKQAIPTITSLLNDDHEWVKLSAGQALKTLGMEGETINPNIIREENVIFDMFQHILSTL